MLTKIQVLEVIKAGKKSKTLDGRDYARLCIFLTEDEMPLVGQALKDGYTHTPQEFSRENILAQLEKDVAFGFEKALNQRGISSSLMYEVVLMWMWVLEDELQHIKEYAQYGLPLFKAVAVKYDFNNPIGDNVGDEDAYSEGYGDEDE